MQFKDVRPEPYIKALRCDRCNLEAGLDDPEFHEFVSVDHVAGYASVFGDGNAVQLDLCQACVKECLGAWLRVSEPRRHEELAERLRAFSPERHGGEFPSGEVEA